MTLSDRAKSLTGLFGKAEKPMAKPQVNALRRDIETLEREFARIQEWEMLALQDKENCFRKLMEERIEGIKERYHSCDPASLPLLQVQHTLLKELLFSYLNGVSAKNRVLEELKKKREQYGATEQTAGN
jgi:hypothetical protein